MRKGIDVQIKNAKLLAGKVLDSLNKEQKEALSEWEKSAQNRILAKDILDEQAFDHWNQAFDGVDASEQWEVFLKRMNKEYRRGKSVRMQVYKAVASIAAVLVIGIALFVLFQKHEYKSQYQSVVEASIGPGSSQAQLILNSGQVVDLEGLASESIDEGSMSIHNKEGILEYQESDAKKELPSMMNTLKIPRGGEYQLVLPDGTQVWLNSDSELKFNVPFTGKERRVQLRGEAYFDVAHNANKPFIVESSGQSVEVLGTEFNISAYPEDLNIITTLVEGKVLVEQLLDGQTAMHEYLEPNQQTVLNKETKNIFKHDVETYLYTSWKEGRFKFDNEPLESFLTKVARWYDVDVFITDDSVKDIRFTGDLPRYKDMNNILNIIEAEMSVHIEIEDNKTIYVSR
ncbi:FecR domain-containing protein [Carboxylicivirga sediminis]|uniref:FecR domain-containing protein n=1 Tax=Carboxylicivirga sediminis TaxID=2006564 RepID=A0A941F4J1_9BACT|nr:FecR domain-containing protein [Carboxylicivirga sediminis]MBR8535808.1 FecR domain-containing protein [Carboxylicivirga sediminis]